jgi:hypothetical protein
MPLEVADHDPKIDRKASGFVTPRDVYSNSGRPSDIGLIH